MPGVNLWLDEPGSSIDVQPPPGRDSMETFVGMWDSPRTAEEHDEGLFIVIHLPDCSIMNDLCSCAPTLIPPRQSARLS